MTSVKALAALSSVILGTFLFSAGNLFPGEAPQRQLAVCFAIPPGGNIGDAAANDMQLLYQALRSKGFHASQILSLSGKLTREQILDTLREAHRRIADWPDGQVVLYYTGSGYFPLGKRTAKGEETGWELSASPERHVLWNEIFNALDLPKGVRLLLFPDCCYTNTLSPNASNNKVPPGAYGMVLQGSGDDIECQAGNGIFLVSGKRTPHGILTYFATQAMRDADSVDDWVKKTMSMYNDAVAKKSFDYTQVMTMVPLGDPKQPLFGAGGNRPTRRE